MKHGEEFFELLKIWHYLQAGNHHWPEAILALENKINELLLFGAGTPPEDWQIKKLDPKH